MAEVSRMLDAIIRGDRPAVEALLAQDPALAGGRMASGESPVLIAAYRGAAEILELLLARKPALSPFEAAVVGDVGALKDALAADAGLVRARSHDGWTLLHLAAFFGKGDAVAAVLRAGGRPRDVSENREANTALHAALAGRGDPGIVASLIARGADVNQRDGGGHTALHIAAFRGDAGLLNVLLAHGADPEATNRDGKTAQRIAEERGHAAAARRLRGEAP
jgi:ankyrin repeat protein